MSGPVDPALHEHYALGQEWERLAGARGTLEFERTKEIVLRHLPAPRSLIADIGGGPGRYALWLAGRGHRVEHRDLTPPGADLPPAPAGPAAGGPAGGRAGRAPGRTGVRAAMSRWAPRLDGELRARLYESVPGVREETPGVERSGWLPPLFPGSFSGYCHRPRQLRAELLGIGPHLLPRRPARGDGRRGADRRAGNPAPYRRS